MYRNFFPSSIHETDLRTRNRDTAAGVRYCNGTCQDFRLTKDFYTKSGTALCINCLNAMNAAKKQISEGKITIEQFRRNPGIVAPPKAEISTIMRKCKSCAATKPITSFEQTKNTCKTCVHTRAVAKSSAEAKKYIAELERFSMGRNGDLEKLCRQIPKEALNLVISHFKIGRKSTDTKDKMVFNVVNYFKAKQPPCDDKPVGNHIQKMVNFEENFGAFIENLKPITGVDSSLYNLKQIILIARHFGITLGKLKKAELIGEINKKLAEPPAPAEASSSAKIAPEIVVQNFAESSSTSRKTTITSIDLSKLSEANFSGCRVTDDKLFSIYDAICMVKRCDVKRAIDFLSKTDVVKKDLEMRTFPISGHYPTPIAPFSTILHILYQLPGVKGDILSVRKKAILEEETTSVCAEEVEEAEEEEEVEEKVEEEEEVEGKENKALTKKVVELESGACASSSTSFSTEKTLILNGITIIARPSDGYINATQMCKAGGKLFNDYNRNERTESYLNALSCVTGIPVSQLIIVNKGNSSKFIQGTWVHRKVAMHLAQWISPVFAVQVTNWITDIEDENKVLTKKVVELECAIHSIKNLNEEISTETLDFKLILKDNSEITIPVSKDGFVNCTKLCQAGGKRIDNWIRLQESQELINAFLSIPQNRGIAFPRIIKGGNSLLSIQGSYYPIDIAVQIAQWVSPSFALQVSAWTKELLITGKVELGKEKSSEEIEKVFKEKLTSKLSINTEPYQNKSIIYFHEFEPSAEAEIDPLTEDQKYYEFGVTSDIKKRIASKQANKEFYQRIRFDRIFDFKDRSEADKAEYRTKQIIKDFNLQISFKFNGKKNIECFSATEEELFAVYKEVEKYSLEISRETPSKINMELEKYKIDSEKAMKIKEKEKENEMIYRLFTEKHITFEQMNIMMFRKS